jgi:hypothetical protein
MRVFLKTAILLRYPTGAAFCRAVGWSDEKLSRLITRRRGATEAEKKLLAAKLGLSEAEIERILA